MKFILSSCVVSFVCATMVTPSLAAISYTGGILFEDFDSLPTSGISDFYENDSDVVEWGFQRSLDDASGGTSGWEGTQVAGSQVNGSTNGMHLNAITAAGSSTAGTVGSAGTGNGDQAIYTLASASFTPAMGVEVVNNSGAALNSISISFTQEIWRIAGDNSSGSTAGVQNIMPAEWGTTDTGVGSSDFLTATTGFTAVTDLNLVGNTPNLGDAAVFVDGNDAANQVSRSATINFGTPLNVGESFFLRYTDFNDPGRDASIAIDNLLISDTPLPDLSVEVDRISGNITLMNSGSAGGPGLIRGYSITSDSGALNASPANFKSITNNYDAGNPGPDQIDADDDWTILTDENDGSSDLSEYQFGGSPGDGASIAVGQSVVLGQGEGAWIPTPEGDLEITVTLADGFQINVPVNYTGNGGNELDRSDLNHDGMISGLDWTPFINNHMADLSAFSEAQQYARGDLDGDGDNDVDDFLTFQADYDLVNGSGSFAAMLQSVPEPSSLFLLSLATIGWMASRPKRSSQFSSCHN